MKKAVIFILLVIVVAAGIMLYMFVLKGEPEPTYDQYSPGEYFVTNVKESNRLLKTSIVLELDSDKMQEELTEKNTLIRDTIIIILRELDETEVRAPDVQEKLREMLKDALNKQLGTEHIIGILFNDFVMH